MRIRVAVLFTMLILIPAIAACKRNPYKIDISAVNENLEVARLERDLFEMDPAQIPASVPGLRAKFGSFLQLFSYVINAGNVNESLFGEYLVKFCTDKLNNEVYESVMKLYPDIEEIEEEMEKAFRHYRYYFPDAVIPAVFTCITGFNNSLIIGDSVIGIGLDRYLGSSSDYYKRLQIYRYISARMNSRNIVPDCMYGWAASEWDYESAGYEKNNVMTSMIHEGKLKYFQKCMMPDINDTILFGFTSGQMKFCRNNEMQMWHYLVEHDLLFSTDQFTVRKLTGEAPFTTYFTSESPGRAAVWTGFRIVESFMVRNRNVTLGELMHNSDIQGILERSRYNPQ